MSSRKTRERRALGQALQALPNDTRAISPHPFAITGIEDGGVSVTGIPPIYLSQSGKEIEKGKFSFLTRLFRRAVVEPKRVAPPGDPAAGSWFQSRRRRLSFYRNNS